MAFTFSKEERLSRTTHISKLFEKGNPKVNGFPFRFTWVYESPDGPFPARVMFVVPRRSFPRANKRNRIRRQMRELYRHHKQALYDALKQNDKRILISISFNAPAPLPTVELTAPFMKALGKLIHEIQNSH